MDVLDIARWQFGIITVYHFLFVPITIGMSAIVAGFETAWVRTGKEHYLRLTKFFGKLFLINFAIGVVTGIVQEFQFGMNWSDYSRFVGDIFGAPLAIEGLLAFFLESTFLGLWIFGWDKLPRKLHVTCIWLVHIGTLLSALFILAANSFMQHPVGYTAQPDDRPRRADRLLGGADQQVQLATFPHTVTACYMTGGAFVLGVAFWLMVRRSTPDADRPMYRTAVGAGAVVALVGGLGVAVTGDVQGKVMTEVQPMKMAAAEALYDTEQPASFSLFTIGSLDGSAGEVLRQGARACCPSWPPAPSTARSRASTSCASSTRRRTGQDPGAKYYSPGDYTPVIPMTYWTFRLMIGLGLVAAGGALVMLWKVRRGRHPDERAAVVALAVIAMPLLPVVANSFGWIFTEMGRQPWTVFGLMTTADAVSPGVSVGEALTSVIVLTLLYGVLAVIEIGLMLTYVRRGAEPFAEPPDPRLGDTTDEPLAFAY